MCACELEAITTLCMLYFVLSSSIAALYVRVYVRACLALYVRAYVCACLCRCVFMYVNVCVCVLMHV
jgi:hypothetical protein